MQEIWVQSMGWEYPGEWNCIVDGGRKGWTQPSDFH